jgi:hypothetical protein
VEVSFKSAAAIVVAQGVFPLESARAISNQSNGLVSSRLNQSSKLVGNSRTVSAYQSGTSGMSKLTSWATPFLTIKLAQGSIDSKPALQN